MDLSTSILDQAYESCILVVSLFGCEILYRILTVCHEYMYNWTHYSSNYLTRIFTYAFTFNSRIKSYFVPIFIIFLFVVLRDKSSCQLLKLYFFKLSLPYVVLRILHFTYSNVELSKWIRSGSGVDYATGMAANYFHGYLHLQLPETGHDTKGLIERIADYEDAQQVTFPIKKLFILIPQSMHTKPKIESKIMDPVKHLETVILDRAGVKRPFKSAVYRVHDIEEENKSWYVVLEGATPMMSFYESIMHRWTSTPEMVDMQREITLQFYRALKKIIKSCPDTKDLVELVYYNDLTADGNNVDVGEIVWHRIKRLKNKY